MHATFLVVEALVGLALFAVFVPSVELTESRSPTLGRLARSPSPPVSRARLVRATGLEHLWKVNRAFPDAPSLAGASQRR